MLGLGTAHDYTRIMLQHLSGGASIKKRGGSKGGEREKKEERNRLHGELIFHMIIQGSNVDRRGAVIVQTY